jgi:hypothetical protein
MKKFAYVLMAVGVLVAIIAFNLDVTVGDSGITNMNMMAQRQNLLIVGCVGFLGGIVLLIGALQQVNSKVQPPVPEQTANVFSVTSTKSMAIAFWKQRDMGRKLVLVSASLLLLSFCFPWEESSITSSNGPYALPGRWIGLSHAAIGLLLWVYPCFVSATKASLHTNGLTFNGVVAALWIGRVAYKFYDFHEEMAEQTAIQMENGVGFWIGLVACVVLIAGIVMIVRAAADHGMGQVISED